MEFDLDYAENMRGLMGDRGEMAAKNGNGWQYDDVFFGIAISWYGEFISSNHGDSLGMFALFSPSQQSQISHQNPGWRG